MICQTIDGYYFDRIMSSGIEYKHVNFHNCKSYMGDYFTSKYRNMRAYFYEQKLKFTSDPDKQKMIKGQIVANRYDEMLHDLFSDENSMLRGNKDAKNKIKNNYSKRKTDLFNSFEVFPTHELCDMKDGEKNDVMEKEILSNYNAYKANEHTNKNKIIYHSSNHMNGADESKIIMPSWSALRHGKACSNCDQLKATFDGLKKFVLVGDEVKYRIFEVTGRYAAFQTEPCDVYVDE